MPAPLRRRWLDDDREGQRLGRGGELVQVVHDARARHAHTEPRQQRGLPRLTDLVFVDGAAVERRHSGVFELRQQIARVEDGAGATGFQADGLMRLNRSG